MGIHSIELAVLLLMTLVVAFASVAKRLETPYPIILAISGLPPSLNDEVARTLERELDFGEARSSLADPA